MGRATYESIGHPLPYRTNVVVTRQQDWSADGVLVAHSVEEGIALAQDADGDVMVIGGGHIYRDAMPLADAQVLTEVHQSPDGDTHYPELDAASGPRCAARRTTATTSSGWSAGPPDRSRVRCRLSLGVSVRPT